jgi:hypothetical protein
MAPAPAPAPVHAAPAPAPAAASYPPPPAAASYPPPPAAPSYPPPPTSYPPPGGDPAFMQGMPAPGPGTDSLVAMPGGKFAGLIEMSVRRAFRLRIEPDEVLPAERAALELAQPPITDRNLQAFLAWRRSVLLVVATLLAPLSILRLIDSLRGPAMPGMFRAVGVLPALAEAAFCGICIWQLAKWTHWRQQRKMIFVGWVVFMATPFIVFLYPLSRSFGNVGGGEEQMLIGMVMSIAALFSLAPKAISLMPGITRAALVSKMLFPGSAGPGWLIVLAAPIYALFAFVILIVPYQITGSGWFVLSMIALIGAQVILARAGFLLAQPTNHAVAVAQVNRVRNTYLIASGLGVLFLVIALVQLVKAFDVGYLTVFTMLLSFAANVLILTMIGSDIVITNLDRARALTQGTAKEVEDTNLKLAAFVGGSEPPAPPPFR